MIPLFERANEIAIVAAFVQESGLDRIQAAVESALVRGARIRVIAGDYLNITQAGALETLLDWEQAAKNDDGEPGRFLARVIEVERLPTRNKSFHPKSWRFESTDLGVAFVGSSNLSRSALESGIEWNLRVDRDRDATAYTRVRDAFEGLWVRARNLDPAWIEAYALRARRAQLAMPPGEEDEEAIEPPPAPHDVQIEALERLRACRGEGRERAIAMRALVKAYPELYRDPRAEDSAETATAAKLVDQCGRLLATIDAHRQHLARVPLDRWPF